MFVNIDIFFSFRCDIHMGVMRMKAIVYIVGNACINFSVSSQRRNQANIDT